MSQHTPGPWKASMRSPRTRKLWTDHVPPDALVGEYPVVCIPQSNDTVSWQQPWRPPFVMDLAQQEADAHLMAASLDLFAVAERLVAWGHGVPNAQEVLADIIHDAKEAITKTKGGA